MQGRNTSEKPTRVNHRVVGGIMAMVAAVTAVSLFMFWRVDRVQENVEAMNQFYVPALKHLNLINGKWSAYQRSFEQTIAFRKWGGHGVIPATPRLRLKKMIEGNLEELARTIEKNAASRLTAERTALAAWVERIGRAADRDPTLHAELESFLKLKRYGDAAALYTQARQENLAITQELMALSREIESRISLLQLSTEQELRNSQGIVLILLATSLLFSLVVLIRLQRWLRPIVAWTKVAQEIAIKGLSREIAFPKITRGMPPEISLLTREFSRMGMTVLERERTIRSQKDKLESLNQHLKEQNELLRKLGGLNERILNSMTSGLLVIGADGRIDQFNERYCEMFGVDRKGLLGTDARSALQSWPRKFRDEWLSSSLTSESGLLSSRISRAGSENCLFDVRVQPLHAKGGRLILFEDVTRIVEAEEKLAHARKLVLAGNLSSQVAHEVRNPLNSMSLQIEMLEEDLAGVEGARSAAPRIQAIAEQVNRLERITARYLDVGRSTLQQASSDDRHGVDMHALIEKCLAFVSGEIQAAGVSVALDLKARQTVVRGEADSLAQVLFNLFRNAIEALADQTHSVPRRIAIETESDARGIVVRVRDSGPGIDDSIRGKIFEPFVTTKPGGHGLGLSLSRQVCIEHGGELRVCDENDTAGAAFEMRMPAAAEKAGLQ